MSTRVGSFPSARPISRDSETKTDDAKRRKQQTTIVIVASVMALLLVIVVVVVIILIVGRGRRFGLFANAPIVMDEKTRKSLHKRFGGRPEVVSPAIFVAISSYRDPELCLTLEDLFDKSLFPNRVHVGVIEQNHARDPPSCHAKNANLPKGSLRLSTMSHKDAKGPTYARSVCEGLWQGEEYYMMTDSHMRFEPGWDVELISMLLLCRRPKRTIITMYPEGYERSQANKDDVRHRILIRRGWRFEQIKRFNDQGIVEFESFRAPPKKPEYVPMYAACFAFAQSDVLKIVPYHPETPYLFFGEEMFMGVRALSHGYDLVGPCFSVCYHLWNRAYRRTFWEHDVIAKRDQSIRKVKEIMIGTSSDEKFGMGKVRSWKEIQNYLGIEFGSRKFTRPHQPWKLPSNFRELKDEFVQK